MKRFMVKSTDTLSFLIVEENGEKKVATTLRRYETNTQTRLDFIDECVKKFNKEFPDVEGMTWQLASVEDFDAWPTAGSDIDLLNVIQFN